MTNASLAAGRRWRAPLTTAAVTGLLAVWTLLAGCAGAPPASEQRYVLGNAAPAKSPPANTTRGLRITSLRLAPFLRGEGIVMQTSEVSIHEARSNLWAEDLATQLQRTLRRELARRLRSVRVLEDSDAAPAPEQVRRLEVDVTGFQGRYDGVAVVNGQWRLLDADGKLLLSNQFSRERPLQADGYQALVESLAAVWRSVAAEIARALKQTW